MIYEIINHSNITYNYKNLLSLYFDEYTYAGGAHGSTIRKSQTWDLQLGMQIPLQAFFSKNEYYLIDILKQVNIQIKNQIEQGNKFFQQYDIAPYSSGIQTFVIKQ